MIGIQYFNMIQHTLFIPICVLKGHIIKKHIQESKTMDQDIRLLDLLKNKEEFDQDEDKCVKCQDLVTDPINCAKCYGPYCLKCGVNNTVCLKCKAKWDFEKNEPKGLELICPFSKQCSQELTPEIFIQHILTSEHVDQEIKEYYKSKLGNACDKGHQLKLMVDTFKNLTNQQCANCKKVGLARMQCQECNSIYCVKCRPIPLVNGTCSQNHKLSHVIPKQNLPFLCDKCEKKEINPKGYYIDKKCNIGICQKCIDL